MSWASHNPEEYDSIIKRGIRNWLVEALNVFYVLSKKEVELLDLVVDVLYADQSTAESLRELAAHEIATAEANHWADKIDAVMDRDR